MIPQPPGSASSCRAGYGLTTSMIRKRTKPRAAVAGVKGRNRSEIHIPTTSSTTTMPGSSTPAPRATLRRGRGADEEDGHDRRDLDGGGQPAQRPEEQQADGEPAVPGAIGE